MPTPPKNDPSVSPDPSMYPELESFVEVASPGDVDHRFDSLRDGIADLKGPRVEHGKKALKALTHVEDLLRHLLGVRQEILAKGQKSKK